MSRPRKQIVDYFPHMCAHKKTMFILEQKYGNDGYAFWFKLLEMLGSTEGHCIHFINGIDWEFLIAKTRLDKEKCTEILDLLATLGAIDKELWDEKKVWSDHFIENIKDAYRNRTADIPTKPSILRKKPINNGNNDVSNPHTKLNYTKLNNINTLSVSDETDELITPKPPKKFKKPNPLYPGILEYWNNQKIIVHKELTAKAASFIKAKLDIGYSEEDIKKTIHNYWLVITGEDYWFAYKWILEDFLNPKNFEKFKDAQVCMNNYLKNTDNKRQ